MSLITDAQLSNIYDVPIHLPLTEMVTNQSLVIASFELVPLMQVSLRFLQLFMTDGVTANETSLNTNVTLSLFLNFDPNNPAASTPEEPPLSLTLPGVASRDFSTLLTLNGASSPLGVYSWVLTVQPATDGSTSTVHVCANGAFRVDLNQ